MKRTASSSVDTTPDCTSPTAKRKRQPQPSSSLRQSSHWSMGLDASMKDPDMVVQSDELTVTIKDRYPKAQHHYLVLPRQNIKSLKHLNKDHLSLLNIMLENGRFLEEKLKAEDKSLVFRRGYHASPSMARLHMHVISQDFVSPCLKNKKHWNSFTTNFFVDAESVVSMLEVNGEVSLDKVKYEEMLTLPLQCHVCREMMPNMPKLKSHIAEHTISRKKTAST